MTAVINVAVQGETISVDSQCVGERLAAHDTNADTTLDTRDGLMDQQVAEHLAREYGHEFPNRPCSQRPWAAQFSGDLVMDLVALIHESRQLASDLQTFEQGLNVRRNVWDGIFEVEAPNSRVFLAKKAEAERLKLAVRLNAYADHVAEFVAYHFPMSGSREQIFYLHAADLPSGVRTLIGQWIEVNNQFKPMVGYRGLELECDALVYSLHTCGSETEPVTLSDRRMFYPYPYMISSD